MEIIDNLFSNITPGVAAIAGIALSTIHTSLEENAIPSDSQCRYFLPISTDIGAWLVGAYVMYSGFKSTNSLLVLCGGMIVGIHTSHYMAHKVMQRVDA